jgi:hypothetical protein
MGNGQRIRERITAIMHTGTIDERDRDMITRRMEALNAVPGPRVGDFVEFPGDITRRISYIWPDEPASVQTSRGGSYYLGNGYVSMSGSLYVGVPAWTLTDTGETRDGAVWVFHHDYHTGGNGVGAMVPFRVFRCSVEAPRS